MTTTLTTTTTTPVLMVDGVAKAFGHGPPWRRRLVEVLRGASLEVRPGELVGLVGENGSGKSLMMRVMVGLLARDGGTVTRPPRLAYCPQQPLLYDKLTGAEHFELFAQAYGLDPAQASDSRDRPLAELNFAKCVDCRVEELSGAALSKPPCPPTRTAPPESTASRTAATRSGYLTARPSPSATRTA